MYAIRSYYDTDETQIKWNGILGDFAVHFYQGEPLTNIQVFSSLPDQSVSVKVGGSIAADMQLQLAVKDENGVITSYSIHYTKLYE